MLKVRISKKYQNFEGGKILNILILFYILRFEESKKLMVVTCDYNHKKKLKGGLIFPMHN